jgi:hypothetical protein
LLRVFREEATQRCISQANELVQYEYISQQPSQYQQQQTVPAGWESLTPISAQQAKQIKTQQMAAQPAGGFAVCVIQFTCAYLY